MTDNTQPRALRPGERSIGLVGMGGSGHFYTVTLTGGSRAASEKTVTFPSASRFVQVSSLTPNVPFELAFVSSSAGGGSVASFTITGSSPFNVEFPLANIYLALTSGSTTAVAKVYAEMSLHASGAVLTLTGSGITTGFNL